MKSLMLKFLQHVLTDVGTWCHVSTHLDFKTIEERVEHEGLSFLTITLPQFAKDLEKGLEQGWVARTSFTGYSRKTGGYIPKFLGGFLELIFDTETGALLDVPSVDAIRAIRQISLMFGKVALDCSPNRVQSAKDKYIETDILVNEWEVNHFGDRGSETNDSLFLDLRSTFRMLFDDLLTELDSLVYNGKIIPKHGPGATADRLRGNRKYDQKEWPVRLEAWFSWTEFLYPSYSLALNDEDLINWIEPGAERPVRVITVPKTLKTPRIIAIEPTAMQYVQQGILEQFELGIMKNYYLQNLLDWSSQVPNQNLAKAGSVTGLLATLDLSEASDRVSNRLVTYLLERYPSLLGGIQSCRSVKADVDGKIIHLAKFASMGSALCFPIESMVFLAICVNAIARASERQVTGRFIKELIGKVRVYGDDIVVPVDSVDCVINDLQSFGLKVNVDKSFWNGKFRESCGKEYYDGHDVTIVRLRRTIPTSRKHAAELVSIVATRNNLFLKGGFDSTIEWLDSQIAGLIPFPVIEPTSSALGRYSYEGITAERMSDDLQIPLVRAAVATERLPKSYLDGSGALMKFFLRRITEISNPSRPVITDEKHLLRAGRPVSVDIKTRWIQPF